MSYENLKSTQMLATRCAVCARPLRDAVSAELGMGPDCREKYGYNEVVNEVNRERANQLIFLVADMQDGIPAMDAVRQLRKLGFAKLADKIATRMFEVKVLRLDDKHFAVSGPYTEAAVASFRNVPGRRWDGEKYANIVPVEQKAALWAALKRAYPGHNALGPDGQFFEIPRARA